MPRRIKRQPWNRGADSLGRYHGPKGRLVSKTTWRAAVEQFIYTSKQGQGKAHKRKLPQGGRAKNEPTKAKDGAFWAGPKKFRTSLGQTVAVRPDTAKGRKHQAKLTSRIQQGKVPRADKTINRQLQPGKLYPDATAPGRTLHYQTKYWRFEGLESDPAIRGLLTLLQAQRDNGGPQWLTAINIGTGFAKDSDWIGSQWDKPRATRLYLDIWQKRPSAQKLLERAEQGGPIWFEVVAEAEVQPKQGGSKRGKHKSGTRKLKRGVKKRSGGTRSNSTSARKRNKRGRAHSRKV